MRAATVPAPGFVFRLGLHEPGSALPRHIHDDPTICYVVEGGFTEYSPGEVVDCSATTLKVMPAGEPHWNRFGKRRTRGIRIDVDLRRFEDAPEIRRALAERRHGFGSPAGSLAHRLLAELTARDTAGPTAAEGLALELLAELARSRGLSGYDKPRWLMEAEDLIRAQYRAGISVGEVARTVGVNPATLSRAYRRRYGCTPGERIRALRVEYAAQELRGSSAPLSEVALRAGFYDQSHFTNVFRRFFRTTPAAYRASHGRMS